MASHLKSKAPVQGGTGQSKRMCHKQRTSYNSMLNAQDMSIHRNSKQISSCQHGGNGSMGSCCCWSQDFLTKQDRYILHFGEVACIVHRLVLNKVITKKKSTAD